MVGASDFGPEGPEFVEPGRFVFVFFGDNLTKCWVETCDGLVSHPGGVGILLVASYGNRR